MKHSKLIFIFIMTMIPNLDASFAVKLATNILKDKDLQQKLSNAATYISTDANDCYNQATNYFTSSEQDKASQPAATNTPKSKAEQSAEIRAKSVLGESTSDINNFQCEIALWYQTMDPLNTNDDIVQEAHKLIEEAAKEEDITNETSMTEYSKNCQSKGKLIFQIINTHNQAVREKLIQENATNWYEWTRIINTHKKS